MKMKDKFDILEETMKDFHERYVEIMRKTLNVSLDWKYISSRLTQKDFDIFTEVIKNENMSFISMSSINDVLRFSVFVSPEGIKNLKEWYNKEEKKND